MNLKKHILKISLLILLISAGVLCFTSLWGYSGNTQATHSITESHNSLPDICRIIEVKA